MARFGLALHGGAGALPTRSYDREIIHMRGLVEAARDRLVGGASALDVVAETVASLEASGLYVAGRGASPNSVGEYELDACLMDGSTRRAGAVAALIGYESPIGVARSVMDETEHVMLVGRGAARFAAEENAASIADPAAWFTRAARGDGANGGQRHGTVGCVVRDADGRLAAATSTGGTFDKLAGRVGDTPIAGAGCWADKRVAVSCTGLGEYFIRTAAAVQVAHRMRFAGEALEAATAATLDEIRALGGDGGLIAIDTSGNVAMPFISQGMKRAALLPSGEIVSAAF